MTGRTFDLLSKLPAILGHTKHKTRKSSENTNIIEKGKKRKNLGERNVTMRDLHMAINCGKGACNMSFVFLFDCFDSILFMCLSHCSLLSACKIVACNYWPLLWGLNVCALAAHQNSRNWSWLG